MKILLNIQSSDPFADAIIAFIREGWNDFSNKLLDATIFFIDDLTEIVESKLFWMILIIVALIFLINKISKHFNSIDKVRSEHEY